MPVPDRHASDFWVFGYGSLMWNPGFPTAEAVHARLTGYHRAFCIYSMHYRGTPSRPGLILGLDRGGACEGVALRVSAESAPSVRRYLRARELVTGVYRETRVPVTLIEDGYPEVMATAFVVERAHPAFAGDLALEVQARLVRKARGLTGFNLDYVLNTAGHLVGLGIREPRIERLAGLLGPHLARAPEGAARASRSRAMALGSNGPPLRVPAGRLRLGDRKRFLYRRAIASD